MTADNPAVEAPDVLIIAPVPDKSPDATGAGIARATTLLAFGTIVSRILGFTQELLMAHYFQPGLASLFQIAITIPRDLYDLAISGHVNSALVPVLTEYATTKDRAELWRLVSLLSGGLALVLSGIVLMLEIFAAQVVSIYLGNVSPEAIELTIRLLRLTSPALLFLGLFAVYSGTLYALKRFTAPAFGAAMFNGTLVVFIVLLVPVIGIERAAIGWLVGAAMQFGLQAWSLRSSPIRLSVRGITRHPGVRRISILYIPVMFSLIFDVLINRTFSYRLASDSGHGNVAYMNWATSLREFPMGLVATAISIAILPTLARQALDTEKAQDFKNTLGQGIRLALSLIVPASVGMFVLAGPLVGLLFEHGQFTAVDTVIVSLVLRLYLLGIPFAAIDLLLVFAFYARKDTLTPALIGIFSLFCYMAIALLLENAGYGFYGLMIADSMKFLIHTTLALVILRRRLGGFGQQRLMLTLIKVVLATMLMAVVTYAVMRWLTLLHEPQGVPDRALLVFLPALAGVLTYVLMTRLLRLREFGWFVQMISARFHR